MQDQGRQLNIFDCSLRIVEAEKFGCDVLRLLNLPDPVDPVLIGVDPYSPRSNARDVTVLEVGGVYVDYIHQLDGTDVHDLTYISPEVYTLM